MYPEGYKDAWANDYAASMESLSKKEQMKRKDPLVQKYASNLGANLRRLRKAQGLPQERLGLMIGSKHSRISNIEHGHVALSFSEVAKLCRALDVDPSELIDISSLTLADHPEQPEHPGRHARP